MHKTGVLWNNGELHTLIISIKILLTIYALGIIIMHTMITVKVKTGEII